MARFSLIPLLTLTAFAVSAEVAEETMGYSNEIAVVVPAEDQSYQESLKKSHSETDLYGHKHKGPKQPLTYNAGPKVQDGVDATIAAEFLYMRAAMDGYVYTETGYVNSNTVTTGTGNVTKALLEPSKGVAYSPPISYNPGFRVTLGSMLNHGGWDVSASYLWFYSSNHRSAVASYKQPFQDLQSAPTLGSVIGAYPEGFFPTKHSFSWKQTYQVASLTFGRNYYTNRHLKLRPNVGVRATWQKKDINLDYSYKDPLTEANSGSTFYQEPPFDLSVRDVNRQWGAGPFAGLDSAWHFTDHFSLYGGFSYTGFFFQQKASNRLNVTYIGQSTSGASNPEQYNTIYPLTAANLVDVTNEVISVKPMMDCSFGVRAETYFADFTYHILLQIGWEAQYWPNQVLILKSSNSTTTHTYHMADFSIQGGTIKLRIDF